MATTKTISSSRGPIKAIHIQVPIGIPTADGGLEIPNRIFLGGIPTETTELELELFFSDFGAVKDVRIVTDRISGESKGYGFVTYEESEDITVMLRKKTITMKGKKLRIRKAVRRNGSQFLSSDGGTNSDHSSSQSSDVNSPTSSSASCNVRNGDVFFVPQTISQELPQIGNYHPISIPHAIPVHPGSVPVTTPIAYPQQVTAQFQPIYCYPNSMHYNPNLMHYQHQSYVSPSYYQSLPMFTQM